MKPWLMLAAVLLAVQAVRADVLADARAATDRRDWTTALPLYDTLLQQRPQDADLLIEAARVRGFADHNAAAAALYRRALGAAPARRADILPSLAWQSLWAGDAAAAVPLFDELVRNGSDRADAYDGLGQSHQALGDDRRAAAAFGAAAALRPDQPALRRRWAQALYWSGYEERALALLAGTTDSDAAWLRDYRLGRESRHYLYAGLDHTIDSDRLETWALTAGAGWRLGGSTTAELRTRQLSLTDANGVQRGPELQGLVRRRFGEPDGSAGTLWSTALLRARRFDGWTPLTGLLRATWVPQDRWRIDAEATREVVETPLAVRNRVHVDVLSIGVDLRLHPRWLGTAALTWLHFDDGNRRLRTNLRAEHVLLPRPRWTIGAELMQFGSSAPTSDGVPGRGYWNPARYAEQRVFTGLRWEQRPWDLQLRLGLGLSQERDGWGQRSTGHPSSWEVALGWDIDRALRLQAQLAGSGPGQGLSRGGAGYSRRSAGLSLTAWF